MTMRWLRSASFSLIACRSTIRFPYTLPRRIIAPVVIVLRTSLVAVPAFIRVEPAITSGPTSGTTHTSTRSRIPSPGSVQQRKPVRAPSSAARSSAPRTYGVVLDVAMPNTKSSVTTPASSSARAPSSGLSSAPSWLRTSAT
jgi:hypothetical protein